MTVMAKANRPGVSLAMFSSPDSRMARASYGSPSIISTCCHNSQAVCSLSPPAETSTVCIRRFVVGHCRAKPDPWVVFGPRYATKCGKDSFRRRHDSDTSSCAKGYPMRLYDVEAIIEEYVLCL